MKENNDVKIAKYFCSLNTVLKNIEITKDDEKKFIEYSSHGKHKLDKKLSHFADGFSALIAGKRHAGFTMAMWEESVLSGDVPYLTLFGDRILPRGKNIFPEFIVKFASNEMFKGLDRKLIMDIYNKNIV